MACGSGRGGDLPFDLGQNGVPIYTFQAYAERIRKPDFGVAVRPHTSHSFKKPRLEPVPHAPHVVAVRREIPVRDFTCLAKADELEDVLSAWSFAALLAGAIHRKDM